MNSRHPQVWVRKASGVTNASLCNFRFKVDASSAQLASSGIYEWRIKGVGVYVGKSTRLAGRKREYPNNVRKLISGLPYRKGNPDGFRPAHRELARAYKCGTAVTFSVLETCAPKLLNERERFWIRRRRDEAAAGGSPVLNSN